MFHRLLLWMVLLAPVILTAQDATFFLGATSSGMSNANINNEDIWALFNNPAGLASRSNAEAAISYQNRFNTPAFQTVGLGLIYPRSKFVPGFSFYRFGDDVYNQQKIGFSLASKLQMVSLGIGMHYIQHHFDELGNLRAMVIDFGGIAEIIKGLKIGAHVFNVNQATLNDQESVATMMRLGLSYAPSGDFILTTELEKHLELPENLKIGLAYSITNWVAIRTGFSSVPRSFSFGMGIKASSRFKVDYAFVDRKPAGIIHDLSLSYSLGEE